MGLGGMGRDAWSTADVPARRIEDGDAPQATVSRRQGVGGQGGQPFEIPEFPWAVPPPTPCVDVLPGTVEHEDLVSASVDYCEAAA
ncbi:MAG: hypothetical protein J4G03_04160 [Gemmatimonadetes bacterium]|nr:hypothetical protein [Gemmatimonadota bacterium]